jgi:hypothetical protein
VVGTAHTATTGSWQDDLRTPHQFTWLIGPGCPGDVSSGVGICIYTKNGI